MGVLTNLKPQDVFRYFEDICNIPHGSGNMERISAYCVDFAKAHGLDYSIDRMHNVVICKPATAGYETHSTVILQGHLDMVCEKLPDCDIDFNTDSLRLAIDGDFVYAEGTTLGGDDGIAVAMILSILNDDSISHPPIEAVFTTDEEIGMYGAEALDMTSLNGGMLINIDSEEMGVITVSCAGGARVDLTVPLKKEPVTRPCYKITVGGLIGGHSGIDIDKNRLNANKLMGELLTTVKTPFNIVSISGGAKDNVITRECNCTISIDSDFLDFTNFVNKYKSNYEPDMFVNVEPILSATHAYDSNSTQLIVNFINELPYGIISMSEDIDGLVQTSLNLGVLRCDNDSITASFAVRSSVDSEKLTLINRLHTICNKFGGSFSEYGHYPAWEYRKESKLRNTMEKVYSEMYGAKPQIIAIHAGLECGIFASKISDFDAVSIGPDLYDIHTARERLSISSTKSLYEYIIKVLENL